MKRLASLFALLLTAGFLSPAHAFNCAKAGTDVEKAICADQGLKSLDDALEDAYAAAKEASNPKQQKMLARSQKRWIQSREYCSQGDGDLNTCIRDATQGRLNLLTGAPESGPGTGSALTPVFIVQDGSEQVYDLDVSVLRFAHPQSAGEKALNRIADDITSSVKIGPHGEDTGGSTYARQDSLSLTYASQHFLSVLHTFWSDEGGVHGNGGVENFNIDMKSGKVLEIGDVLPEDAASELAARCKAQIIAEKKERLSGDGGYDLATDDFLKDDVIAEHIATLSRWSIGAETTTITFDAYAIGSYAEGSYTCEFPTADIKAMAPDGSPLP